MKLDTLARRAILLFAFVATTAILYELSTKLMFSTPHYNDVGLDPDGDGYDYGLKVAAAVWKGAGEWMGIKDSESNEQTTNGDEESETNVDREEEGDEGQQETPTQEPTEEIEQAIKVVAEQRDAYRRHRLRSRHTHSKIAHLR